MLQCFARIGRGRRGVVPHGQMRLIGSFRGGGASSMCTGPKEDNAADRAMEHVATYPAANTANTANAAEKITEEYRRAQRLIPLSENELQKTRNALIKVVTNEEMQRQVIHSYNIPSFFLQDSHVRNDFLEHLRGDTERAFELREFLQNGEEEQTDGETKSGAMKYAKLLAIFQQFIKKNYYKQWIFYEHVRRMCDFSELSELVKKKKKKTRKLHLYVGPTNSGKTYEAFQRLCKSRNGLYCAPLRILAWEIHKKLIKLNKVTNLLTGQEIIKKKNATHTVCTVEMTPLERQYDCAVIDEIQMINHETRGCAWTNVLLNLECEEIYLCGSDQIINLVKRLADLLHDQLIIKQFERLTKLRVQESTVEWEELKTGDCVITFSRNSIMLLKKRLERFNKRVFVVYGSLPPELKRRQVELFNRCCTGEGGIEKVDETDTAELPPSSDNKKETILIATDVIGMGVNINIRRIIFYSLQKFDGDKLRHLYASEVLQIAGRAGRYHHGVREPITGYVTCVHAHDLGTIRRILRNENDGVLNGTALEDGNLGNSTFTRSCQRVGSSNGVRRSDEGGCPDGRGNTAHSDGRDNASHSYGRDNAAHPDGRDNASHSYGRDNAAHPDGPHHNACAKAGFFPDFNMINKLKKMLEYEHKAKVELHEIMSILVDYAKLNEDYFFLTKNYNQMIIIAKFLKDIKLDGETLFVYSLSPINVNDVNMLTTLRTFAFCHELLNCVDFFECINRDVVPTATVGGVEELGGGHRYSAAPTAGLPFQGGTAGGGIVNSGTASDGIVNSCTAWPDRKQGGEESSKCHLDGESYAHSMTQQSAIRLEFPLGETPSSASEGHSNHPHVGPEECLSVLELYYEIIDLYCWLHTKFPSIYTNMDSVNDEKKKVSNAIIHVLARSCEGEGGVGGGTAAGETVNGVPLREET
ncbi:ATP-dependent RNA helicase SUV3, putative [Plasmodium vivax]|uniref:ATP-dependent RNA helicase SUV3, putative n=1 Tax=Plasmodium vivax TaxID=5855 RepID=A0A564ZXA7_PLAVI|nr:ATP-dependent RNA helicase SUV3, putative [Plasmodium vivax]